MSAHEETVAMLRRAIATQLRDANFAQERRDESLAQATKWDGSRQECLRAAAQFEAAIEALGAQP